MMRRLEVMSAFELIRELDDTYPRPLSAPGDSIESIMWKTGRRWLVEQLLARIEDEADDRPDRD